MTMPSQSPPQKLETHPVTPERWPDLERLFGPRGASGGCWCMWWRLKRSDFERQAGDENKAALRLIVESGQTPGVLAYADGQPAGWCAIAPRECFPALERSRILKRVDDQPVWSVTCFFIAKAYRRVGLAEKLLRAAVEHAREQGAAIVEGYPVEPQQDNYPAVFAWTGMASTFRKAGFVEVARRSETRPIMRLTLDRA
jgi:GNAT superfamily N-acetyltransferase